MRRKIHSIFCVFNEAHRDISRRLTARINKILCCSTCARIVGRDRDVMES